MKTFSPTVNMRFFAPLLKKFRNQDLFQLYALDHGSRVTERLALPAGGRDVDQARKRNPAEALKTA
jgi:hypothetical protein